MLSINEKNKKLETDISMTKSTDYLLLNIPSFFPGVQNLL